MYKLQNERLFTDKVIHRGASFLKNGPLERGEPKSAQKDLLLTNADEKKNVENKSQSLET